MRKERHSLRSKSFLKATVRSYNRNATFDCVVRNISLSGAKLELDQTLVLPQEFELDVPQRGALFRCELKWRKEGGAGVRFKDSVDGPTAQPLGGVRQGGSRRSRRRMRRFASRSPGSRSCFSIPRSPQVRITNARREKNLDCRVSEGTAHHPGRRCDFSGLTGCISSERQLATDKDQCAAQGLAPSTSAFEDCVSVANGRRRDAEARQSAADAADAGSEHGEFHAFAKRRALKHDPEHGPVFATLLFSAVGARRGLDVAIRRRSPCTNCSTFEEAGPARR